MTKAASRRRKTKLFVVLRLWSQPKVALVFGQLFSISIKFLVRHIRHCVYIYFAAQELVNAGEQGLWVAGELAKRYVKCF